MSQPQNQKKTRVLGELVVAAFDNASHHSTDPKEIARLATKALCYALRHAAPTTTASLFEDEELDPFALALPLWPDLAGHLRPALPAERRP